MADITIRPLHTMGAASSTRKPIDMLAKRSAHERDTYRRHLRWCDVEGSPRNAVVGEWDHQIVCRGWGGGGASNKKVTFFILTFPPV